MKKTEKYLKKLIDEMPEYYGDIHFSMDSDCIDPVKKRGNGFQIKHIFAAICILILLISVPVAAKLPVVKERMQTMPQAEVQDLADMTNSQKIHADLFSRPFSDAERNRMDSIREEYENGIFPDGDILLVQGNELTDADFYYNCDAGMFMLPDARELTDDELRQYFDFTYKRNYSLEVQSEAEASISEEQVSNQSFDDLEISEVYDVERVVEKIYDVQSDTYETSVEADIDQNYSILLQSKEDDKCFRIVYNMDKSRIEELNYSQGTDNYTEGVEVNVDEYINNFDYIKNMLVEDLSITEEMEKCYCDYNVSPDGSLVRGMISYLYILENGECYVVKYNCKDKVVSNILLSDYQYYQGIIDLNESKRETRGVTRERIDLSKY